MTVSHQRVLVTGAAGFLGSRIVGSYRASGARVRAVGHRARLPIAPFSADVEFIELDLSDRAAMFAACAGQDLVIHAAAATRDVGTGNQLRMEKINVEGTQNVIDACRDNSVRLLHVSTTAAIGISADAATPADEQFVFNLDRMGLTYNETKYRAEQLVLEATSRGMDAVVVNPGVVFGAFGGDYRGASVIERVRRARLVVCTGGGLSVVHVDDVVDGIRKAADTGVAGNRYILSGQNVTFRDIADTVCRVFEARKIVLSVPDAGRDLIAIVSGKLARSRGRPNLAMDHRYAYQFFDSDKARRTLGYAPRPFAHIVADYREHVVAATRTPPRDPIAKGGF